MAKAAHIAAGPASGPGAAREAGMLLSRAMDAQLLHGELVVLGGPGDHRVGQHGQAPRLLGLAGQVRLGDGALAGVAQVPAQRVQGFALVQLAGDLPPVRRVLTGTGPRGLFGAACPTLSARPPRGSSGRWPTISRRSSTRWPFR